METLGRNIRFVLVDAETGFIVNRQSLPPRLFPPEIPAGQRMVVPADRRIPVGEARFDLRRIRRLINHVPSIDSVLSTWRPPVPTADQQLELARAHAIADLDREFALRLAALRGPLGELHAEKRRQAEAGGGPLVAGADDRAAIIASAERQDAAVAALERIRRAAKAAMRAASSEADLQAAVAISKSSDGKSP